MNEVVERIKEKYPQYKDVPDEELTVKIAAKYPSYLDNASFASDFKRATNRSALASEKERVASSVNPETIANAAYDAVESLTPHGILSLPTRVVNAVAGTNYRDPDTSKPLADLSGAIEEPLRFVERGFHLPPGAIVGPDSPVSGVAHAIEETASGLTAPETAVALPAIASPVGKSILAFDMLRHTQEQIEQSREVLSNPEATVSEKAKALATPAITMTMAATVAAHGNAKATAEPSGKIPVTYREIQKTADEITPVAPLTAAALKETAPKPTEIAPEIASAKPESLLSKPGLSADELINMRPDEIVAWKKNVGLGVEVEKAIAQKLSDADIPKLELERDNLRAKADALNALMEKRGAVDDRTMRAAGEESVKAQTINEIIQEHQSLKQSPEHILPEGRPTEQSGTTETPPASPPPPSVKFIGSAEPGERYGTLRIVGNFDKLKDARAFAEQSGGKVTGYLEGKYKRGWVVVEPWSKRSSASTAADKTVGGQKQEAEQGGLPGTVPSEARAEQSELIGMGGAVPAEFKTTPETPTSIKNAQVDVERQKRGLPPAIQPAKRSFGAVWDETMAKIDRDPGYQDRLIGELRDKPRALTDAEDAALLHRQIDLQNEYGKATRDLAQAYDDGRMDAVGNEQARVAALSDQLLDLYNVSKKVGTETGRGLNARKMMAYEDFSLAKMELEKRAANGGRPLTDAELSEITALQSRIETTQKAYDDYVAKTDQRIAELEVKRALDEVELQAKREPTYHPSVLKMAEDYAKKWDAKGQKALKELKELLSSEQFLSGPINPEVLDRLVIYGTSKLVRGAVDVAKWTESMVSEFGEKFRAHAPAVFEASQKRLNEDLASSEKAFGTQAEKVKRAVKKTDAAEQMQAAADTIKGRITSGNRSDITGQVQKLARLFVERGVKTRDELIDSVHAVLKSIDPNFTRRETMDAISGYGDFKQLTKDEISVKLRDLKGQMQQVAKLEDMQANRPPLKTGIERRIPSPEESRLIKLVNEAKNQFQIPIDDPNTQLKSSLDTLKTRLKNATREFEDKLARGDFSKKPKRIIQMDAEANRLHFENAKAKIAWHEALMKDRLANRSIPAKILGGIGEVLNTSRAILTSLDFSAVLRQGGFVALAHPVRAAQSFPAMFRAFRSEAGQHAVNREITSRKNYPLYNQSKLYLSEHGQKLSQMEEAYMSRWADKIPLVAGSQRAYVTFLNKLRADSFDAMANTLSRSGELTPTEASAISNFINVATGRGNLGMKDNALVGLNTVFFAPRYVASRFQLIAGQPLYRGTARTRSLVAQEYARYLIGVGVVYGLATLDGAEIETDPRSSDFGKLKYGDTRIDPLSGLQQSTVLISRTLTGETKNLNGILIPLRESYRPLEGTSYGASGKPNRFTGNNLDVLIRFGRSKLAPVPSVVANVLNSGENIVGEKITPETILTDLSVPLAFRDIYNVMIEQGVPRGTAFGILSMFGMGLQNYDTEKKKE